MNYYGIEYHHWNTGLIPHSKFWCNFAEHFLSDRCEKTFLSEYLAVPTHTLNEMLLALAVVGLDFTSDGPTVEWGDDHIGVTLAAAKPCVVFSKQLKDTEAVQSAVSISTFYYDPHEETQVIDGAETDKLVSVFYPGKRYGCRIIIANLASTKKQLEVLMQIPSGSLPLKCGERINTTFVELHQYCNKVLKFEFYFPKTGKYTHYPVQVSRSSSRKVVAFGPDVGPLIVVKHDEKITVNQESWLDVASNAKDDDVFTYLETHNYLENDGCLEKVYFRLKNKEFWKRMVSFLRSRNDYNHIVWGYSFIHGEKDELMEYLSSDSGNKWKLFPVFNSESLSYDPFLQHDFTHLEYYPLVNSRTHQLGNKYEISNDRFKNQYDKFLNIALRRSTSAKDMLVEDKLTAVYYLLIQDRIEEAFRVYKLINAQEAIKTSEISYDYLRGYLDFFSENKRK
eukprot:UN29062